MKCAMCGAEFNEETAAKGGCHSCHNDSSHCGMIKCPRCGYDSVLQPEWVKNTMVFIKKRAKSWTSLFQTKRKTY